MPVAETFSNASSSLLRWVRRHLTAEAMLDGLKTAVWVVPLTLLIWVYAEQEKPSNVESQPLQLDIRTTAPDRIVTLRNKQDDMITVDLDGAKASVEAVKKELNKRGENPAVRIEVPADLRDGVNTLLIAPQVSEADIFKKYRVRVGRVSPERIDVQIDTLRTVDAVVKPAPDAPLVGLPTFVPQTVKLTGPKSLLPETTMEWVVYAQIPTKGEYATPGSYPDVPVPLTLPISGDHVKVRPPTVSASFQIKQSNVDYTIRSLPLRYAFTPSIYQQRIIDGAKDTVFNVNVYGPADQIKRLPPNGDFDAYATLTITGDDPIGQPISKPLVYHMPEGVSVKPEDLAKPFEFTLKKPSPSPSQ